jgi:alkylation response protein AidB-like acyl-CoA dehydrogenase
VLEQMGRTVLCAPYFATTVLAAVAVMNAGTEAEEQALLPDIAAGERTATLACVEDNGRWDAEGTALTATAERGQIVLNGHKSYVVDGHTADLIVILARAPQGLSLFTVDGNAAGLSRRALKSMDPTRKFARLEFNRVEARPLGTAGGAAAPFARTMVEAAACLANEMVVGADRLREDALAYAMMRMQFGKPIASFQSMKHKQADVLLEVELAKSAAYYAAASLDDQDDDAVANAHLAKALASGAYMQTAIQAAQIHAASGLPGTMTRTSGSSEQKAPRCCWAMPAITAY